MTKTDILTSNEGAKAFRTAAVDTLNSDEHIREQLEGVGEFHTALPLTLRRRRETLKNIVRQANWGGVIPTD